MDWNFAAAQGQRSNNGAVAPRSCNNNEIIPIDLWEQILCFLDVPDLGTCAMLSKEISTIAMNNDTVWEHHLRKLLRVVFEGAIHMIPRAVMHCERGIWAGEKIWNDKKLPKPLLERPLKSTNFRRWYAEWKELWKQEVKESPRRRCTKINGMDYLVSWKAAARRCVFMTDDPTKLAGNPRNDWLVKDVPLRTYYKKAATFAYTNYIQRRQEQQEEHQSFEEDGDFDSEAADDYLYKLLGYREGDIFRGLPNICLFHSLGGLPYIHNFSMTMSEGLSSSSSVYRFYCLDNEGNIKHSCYIDAKNMECFLNKLRFLEKNEPKCSV